MVRVCNLCLGNEKKYSNFKDKFKYLKHVQKISCIFAINIKMTLNK